MKEFVKKFLILLSTPLYIIVILILFIVALGFKAGEVIRDGMCEWINFMEDDYKKVYEVIKNGSEKTKKR